MPRFIPLAVVAVAALAFAASPAFAGGSPAPAIQQYVEQLPSATGSPPPGGGSASGTRAAPSAQARTSRPAAPSSSPATPASTPTAIPLAPAVEKKVRHAGAAAKSLRQVATNPELGAPLRASRPVAVYHGGDGSMSILVLIGVAAAVAGVGAWAATRGARSRSSHTAP